jgi:capsular polysaccharide transport system permease protein
MISMKPSALTKLFRAEPSTEVARRPDRPLSVVGTPARRPRFRIPRSVRKFLPAFLIIVLPTTVTAFYYGVWASDQYVSEARFLVNGQSSQTMSLLGQLMSSMSSHASGEDLTNVADYLESHDALRSLQEKLAIDDLYRRPEADWFARLKQHPKAEEFLEYYQNKVSISIDSTTGLASLKVRAFRPEDAQLINETLLMLGEDVVNHFSDRQRSDTLKVARDEVQRAEGRVMAARDEMAKFRERESSIDPGKSGALIMEMIARLDLQLAQARAEVTEASTYLKPDSPKFLALRNKVDALEKQIASERKRLTGGDASLSPILGAYERLVLEREFADKGYASAMVSMETARNEAMKQHLYLIRIVEPNLPEKALYPRRWLILSTVFIAMCFTYGIGWLIIAGIREHAA